MNPRPFFVSLAVLAGVSAGHLAAASVDSGVVQVRLPNDDVRLSFVESPGGMTVELKAGAAAVQGDKLYVGDGAVAVPIEANDSGIWFQRTDRLRQGDRFPSGSTVTVHPGYLSAADLERGDVYVILPGVTFKLPQVTPDGSGRVLNLEPCTSGFRSVAFSPDGKLIAAASVCEVKVLEVATGREQAPQKPIRPGSPVGVAFSPDGKHLATTGWHGVKLWDAKSGRAVLMMPDRGAQIIGAIPGGSRTRDVAFNPDGQLIATVGAHYLTIWENRSDGVHLGIPVAAERRLIEMHSPSQNHATDVAFSPDGRRIATATRDWGAAAAVAEIKLWDAPSGELVLVLNGGGHGLAFSPDGRRLVSTSRPYSAPLQVWDVESGDVALRLLGHERFVRDVAFSPDGRNIASASEDGTVRVWDAETGTETREFRGHLGAVLSVGFDPTGRRLASVCAKPPTQVILWDLNREPMQDDR